MDESGTTSLFLAALFGWVVGSAMETENAGGETSLGEI